jgi:hypothetical protein
MGFLSLIAFSTAFAQLPPPVLWLSPTGKILVHGKQVEAELTEGASRVRLAGGYAYDFSGKRGGILFGDVPALRLTESMTVSLWINLRSYVNDGPGAQVLFRGDDRSGVDPYTLSIHGDGTVWWAVQDQDDKGFGVGAEIPLNRWMHVVASFNDESGELQLWLDDERVAYARTSRRPFALLDNNASPGLGIGNVQNNRGPHNQPLNGVVADLRLYDRVLTPDELDTDRRWDSPPVQVSLKTGPD